MNTDKLVKAIQIIIREELKTVLPKLVKESVKRETKSILKENKELKEALKAQKHQEPTFMDEPIIENELHNQSSKQLSKNPMINEVLNQTQPFNSNTYVGSPMETTENTLSFDSKSAPGGIDAMRAQMAAKMGYANMGSGAQPTGIGVETGNPIVDKALNRDYSQLMKALDKKKQPFRPGM